ncbi:MAG TPA: hypothetical protein VHM70_16840 [Polyangiaceae bacterium]|jgi:hypothetical protein|nr:hypothetical protein [Polyangiaceae bacterium]
MKKLLTGIALIATGVSAGCSDATKALDDAGVDNPLAGICKFECKGLAEAHGKISGITEVDAFFSAVAELQIQAASLQGEVQLELANIAGALGVEGAAAMSIDELNAAIKGKIDGGLDGAIMGGISLEFVPPKCQVNASASIEASAKCDASVKGPSAKVECSGSCEASASAMASCSADATLKCEGTPPSFKCEGTCSGTCDLKAGGMCEGACNGTCNVTAEGDCDGEFTASTEAGAADGSGTCKLNAGATCKGSCQGSCDLEAGGSCSGECKGSCEYTPPDGKCDASATAKCEAKADAKVECSGKCEGEATPPMVKAECKATAKADASFHAECQPPKVGVKYELTDEFKTKFKGDLSAQAAFDAKLQAVGKAFGSLQAKNAKIEAVVKASADLATSGQAAIEAALKAVDKDKLSIGAALDLTCGLGAIGEVPAALADATASLNATAMGVATCAGTLAGAGS